MKLFLSLSALLVGLLRQVVDLEGLPELLHGVAFAAAAPIIAAGIGAAGSFIGSLSGRKAAQDARRRLREAEDIFNPRRILGRASIFLPHFRELIAMGIGPGFQQSISSNLARAGLTGSGLGVSLTNAATAAPGIAAFGGALDAAFKSAAGRLSAFTNTPLAPQAPSGFSSALLGGARGFFGAKQFEQQPTSNLFTDPSFISGGFNPIGRGFSE